MPSSLHTCVLIHDYQVRVLLRSTACAQRPRTALAALNPVASGLQPESLHCNNMAMPTGGHRPMQVRLCILAADTSSHLTSLTFLWLRPRLHTANCVCVHTLAERAAADAGATAGRDSQPGGNAPAGGCSRRDQQQSKLHGCAQQHGARHALALTEEHACAEPLQAPSQRPTGVAVRRPLTQHI